MSNPSKLDKIEQAASFVKAAAELLRSAQQDARYERKWGLAGSCDLYAAELEELSSCDHGESGLEQLVSIMKKEKVRG